jgi:hypothetical protein
MKSQLRHLRDLIHNTTQEVLGMSLKDIHAPELFSLVFHCDENKRLKRAFMAGKEIQPYEIQLHTHRYPLRITVLKGRVVHHRAVVSSEFNKDQHHGIVKMDSMSYRSAIVGDGRVDVVVEDVELALKDFTLPVGSSVELTEHDIHTVSCAKDAIWVVEELPIVEPCEYTRMYGVPFAVTEMYRKPSFPHLFSMQRELIRTIDDLTRFY